MTRLIVILPLLFASLPALACEDDWLEQQMIRIEVEKQTRELEEINDNLDELID